MAEHERLFGAPSEKMDTQQIVTPENQDADKNDSPGKRIPETTGKYRINQVVGKGAMGIVYQGFDPHIERVVAIKVIKKEQVSEQEWNELQKRFKQEAMAAGRLQHPNIVTVHEYGEDDGSPYIVMEYVEGLSLGQYVKQKKDFAIKDALFIMKKLIAALDYSHSKGVIHRDIKPQNIFVLENEEVKLSDFGVAKMEASDLTRPGMVLGTPAYMSPEQIKGEKVDARSDLFSAGVIFYEMVTGRRPFGGSQIVAIMNNVLNGVYDDPCSLNPELPDSFRDVINKALSKRPADRYQSAKEFFEGLQEAIEKAPTIVLAPDGSSSNRKSVIPYILGLLLFFGAVGAGAWFWSYKNTDVESILESETQQALTDKKSKEEAIISKTNLSDADLHGKEPELTKGDTKEALASSGKIKAGQAEAKQEQKSAGISGKEVIPAPAISTEQGEDPADGSEQLMQPGFARIYSKPEGADVYIDGKLVGSTPFKGILEPGSHQLILKKKGFTDLKDEFNIDAFNSGEPFQYTAELFRGFE